MDTYRLGNGRILTNHSIFGFVMPRSLTALWLVSDVSTFGCSAMEAVATPNVATDRVTNKNVASEGCLPTKISGTHISYH